MTLLLRGVPRRFFLQLVGEIRHKIQRDLEVVCIINQSVVATFDTFQEAKNFIEVNGKFI